MDPWDISLELLKNYGPQEAESYFVRLVLAESHRVKVPRSLISFSGHINESDKGLDVFIKDARPSEPDLIPIGFSGFQVKTSRLSVKQCSNELHEGEKPNNLIKKGIRRVLDKNGTYVLVIFKLLPAEESENREEAMRADLGNWGYPEAEVKVYSLQQVISFARRYPGLLPDRREGSDHETWARERNVAVPKRFLPDHEREQIIQEVQRGLRSRSDGNVFRIIGHSGLGKTRLIFEALNVDDLKNQVVYISSDQFRNSNLLLDLKRNPALEAIVVVDDCSLADHRTFYHTMAYGRENIALITISNDMQIDTSSYYMLNRLPDIVTKQLLSDEIEGLSPADIDRVATIIDGYPGFINLYSEYVQNHRGLPEDLFGIDAELFFERLLASGNVDSDSESFKVTKRTLMAIAIFKKLGFKPPVDDEAQFMAKAMRIDWITFQEEINKQKKRRLIQGNYYLNITPFPLAIYLMREWFANYGYEMLSRLLNEMSNEKRIEMFDRFKDNIPYMPSTEQGIKLVRELLSPQGFFDDPNALKTRLGSSLFLKIAEADHESALTLLKMTVGKWNEDELLQFTVGRREVVLALERIAVWKEDFPDAARLLLALAEAENEAIANNATGIFVALFGRGEGKASYTEMAPIERLPILFEVMDSPSVKRKKIALAAFENALEGRVFRIGRAEEQGSKPPARLWQAESRDEILNYISTVWTYLDASLDGLHTEIQPEAAELLIRASRRIVRDPSLSEMVRQTMLKLATRPWVKKEELVKAVSDIVRLGSTTLPHDLLKKWETFKDSLTGSSLADQLERYVKMDLHEDYFEESQGYDTSWINKKIRDLADQAISDPTFLEPEYSWIITNTAKRSRIFGYEVGRLDNNQTFLQRIIHAYERSENNVSMDFFGGYLRALYENDASLWEETLDALAQNFFFKQYIPELTALSGMTNKAANRILKMVEEKDVAINGLAAFIHRDISDVAESTIIDAISLLLDESLDQGPPLALAIITNYYTRDSHYEPLPKELTMKVLSSTYFWRGIKVDPSTSTIDLGWSNVAKAAISQFPEVAEPLADRILSSFGDEDSIIGFYRSSVHEFLFDLIKRKPDALWNQITQYLGPPIDKRAFRLKDWLRGEIDLAEPSALLLISRDDIWQWIDNDTKLRAWYFATFVPPLLERDDKPSLAVEFLQRYGDREDVRRNFSANFSTEFGYGSLVERSIQKKERLIDFRKKELDNNVFKWIDEYLEELDQDIERERLWEERGEF